jgi:hypothetical protein
MTERWPSFSWLAQQSVDGLVWAWPITAILFLVLITSAIASFRERRFVRPIALVHLVPIGIPVVILALGASYWCEGCSPSSLGQGHRHLWAMRTADALFVAHVGLAAWLTWASGKLRLVAGAWHALVLWWGLWASFMAGMSMSGDWL